ncbi:MAG: DUF2911 domain-containing protein [Cyclobacteriaceae bacterium]|nr:DUF2911 domain-containing protein [Cyclobacteriaceae bacterium]
MKNKVRLAFIIFVGLLANSALLAQISQPIASPPGSVTSTVGLTEIQIDYFRPKMKGRKIFGEGEGYLLPYGVMWRTGANSGSKITLATM